MNLFEPLPLESCKQLNRLMHVIDKVFPLKQRYRNTLKHDVSKLSELFTSSRQERGTGYLGKPNLLSAYLRYFLPWNIYRLCRLLPSLPIELENDSTIVDLGSGPLSLVLSLWICRPELRQLNLTFRCVDKTPAVLEAGKLLFAAFTENKNTWNIINIKGEIYSNGKLSVQIHGEKAKLVSAINVYNEIFWNFSPYDKKSLNTLTMQGGITLGQLCREDGYVLAAEPGIPRSGEFISLLRGAFLAQGLRVISPCTHQEQCAYPGTTAPGGGKAKWCHFSFGTEGAPDELIKLSAASGLPKDRAVISFVLAGKNKSNVFNDDQKKTVDVAVKGNSAPVRILSDSFPAGKKFGRYGCSAFGAVLALEDTEKSKTQNSGCLIELKFDGKRDAKSGALTGSVNKS